MSETMSQAMEDAEYILNEILPIMKARDPEVEPTAVYIVGKVLIDVVESMEDRKFEKLKPVADAIVGSITNVYKSIMALEEGKK